MRQVSTSCKGFIFNALGFRAHRVPPAPTAGASLSARSFDLCKPPRQEKVGMELLSSRASWVRQLRCDS